MAIELRVDPDGVDWKRLADVYERAPLGRRDPDQLRRAFEASFAVCIAYSNGEPVAAGRAISDGEYYSNIYDVVVLPQFQGQGVGRLIMESLLERVEGLFVLLTTTAGKEPFYARLGFRHHRTAMAIYPPGQESKARLYLE